LPPASETAAALRQVAKECVRNARARAFGDRALYGDGHGVAYAIATGELIGWLGTAAAALEGFCSNTCRTIYRAAEEWNRTRALVLLGLLSQEGASHAP